MNLLKRENWWICLLLNIVTLGLFTFFIAKKLNVYEKGAWYTNWYYWVLGFFFGILPSLIMFLVFSIQIANGVCEKLEVPGREFYVLPYSWLVCIIIPVLGWSLFIILFIYTHIWYTFCLARGTGEKYLKTNF